MHKHFHRSSFFSLEKVGTFCVCVPSQKSQKEKEKMLKIPSDIGEFVWVNVFFIKRKQFLKLRMNDLISYVFLEFLS